MAALIQTDYGAPPEWCVKGVAFSRLDQGRRLHPAPFFRMAKDELQVVVNGTSITVTKPGTNFAVTYQKRFANPHLVLTHTSITESGPAPVREAIHQFRARAFHAAVDKARELGCIV